MDWRRLVIFVVLAMAVLALPWGSGPAQAGPGSVLMPDGLTPAPTYYANSPAGVNPYNSSNTGTPLRKFVDSLPGLGPVKANNLGQYLPVATPQTVNISGQDADYYEIGLKDYNVQMHSDLPKATKLRGYYQKNIPGGPAVGPSQYLGPVIVAQRDRPVRIKFFNELSTGAAGDLFIPVDTTVMGAGMGPTGEMYSQNRAAVHLHGGFTPWISDGTPHQWITPANEISTPYLQGVSTQPVPDMPLPVEGDGTMTLYYPNQQSGRLMFYHDHAYGITRLNVYAGMAAGYLLTDPAERTLTTGLEDVPLIIQDKSFVPQDIATQDSLWTHGPYGDLWFPHVYEPNQDPTGSWGPDFMNPLGRWDYGPWIWPPATVQDPVLPEPSIAPEAFMDTMVVNGTVYPYLEVEPKAYRFRILNACNDRFLNLQLYFADPADLGKTEVAMVPRDGQTYTYTPPGEVAPVSSTVPFDGRPGGVPNPIYGGPKMVQIGTEGGLLPQAVVKNLPPVPVTYDTDPKSMTVGNVKDGTIILGPAERADVVVDFSGVPAGSKLILYNDAPAAFPAGDGRYDYYTGNPDFSDMGGAPSTLPGFGPNTRTVMQFRVVDVTPAPFNFNTLITNVPLAYAASQPRPIVPETDYNLAFANIAAKDTYAKISDTSLTFTPLGIGSAVKVPFQSKAIAEEFDLVYGRMSAVLGTEWWVLNNQGQQTNGFFYVDPPTETFDQGKTQLWKVTHNGVDTHAIHFHLFNVQVVNRVDWAGVVKPPDPNELGWKETVRMNPLEDIIVAMRADLPNVPFTVPTSFRPLAPTEPLGAVIGTQPWPDPAVNPPQNTINAYADFGHEYVWHCHLLGHEENDMMRPLVVKAQATVTDTTPPTVGAMLTPAPNAAGWNNTNVGVTISAADNLGGSGVKSITYSATGAFNQTQLEVWADSVNINLTTAMNSGITTFTYFATDNNGNASAPQTLTVKIDATALAVTATATPGTSLPTGKNVKVTVSGTVSAGTGSPVNTGSGTYSVVDGRGTTVKTGTFKIGANGTYSFSEQLKASLPAGLTSWRYTFIVRASDQAGNVGVANAYFTVK